MLDFFYVLKVVFGSLPALGKAKDMVGTVPLTSACSTCQREKV